jgi:hypothetical protein
VPFLHGDGRHFVPAGALGGGEGEIRTGGAIEWV